MKKNIIISAVAALFILSGCESTAPKEEQKPQTIVQEVKERVQEKIEQEADEMQEVKSTIEEKIEEVIADTIIDESEAPIVQRVEESVASVQESVEAAIPTRTGRELYVSCVACHGADGSRKALNASEPINGWEVERTVQALQGYKDGSYGGRMKASMTGQVANLSDADIQALAEYINSL